MSQSSKVLSYFDVLLRRSDVELLQGPHWLNDQCISFYFEYLRHDGFADPLPADVLLVGPEASYLLISIGAEAAPIVLDPLHFTRRILVLFVINDKEEVTQLVGGNHWSLAVYSRSTNILYHYDSLHGMNKRSVRRLLEAINGYLPHETSLVEQECPQQQNGYDCGVYVLAVAELLCKRYITAVKNQPQGDGKESYGSDFSTSIINISFDIDSIDAQSLSPDSLADFRQSMLMKVHQLVQKGAEAKHHIT